MPTLFNGDNTPDYAVAQFDLVDTMTAYELATIIGTIEGLYTTSLYIEKVESSDAGDLLPAIIIPSREEELFVQRVDIGTPNILSVIGLAEHLYNALVFCKNHWPHIQDFGKSVSTVASAIGGVKGIFDLMEKFKSGRKDKDSSGELAQVEHKGKDIEITIDQFHENGRIDKDTAVHKRSFFERAKTNSTQIVTNIHYTLVSKKQ